MDGSRAICRRRSSSSTPACRLLGTSSGPSSALPEPDLKFKNLPHIKARRLGVVGISLAFSATTSTALRYWNMARQRYCRRLVQNPYTRRVSADPLAQPAAHTRAEGRGFRPTKESASERRTLRWREMDSNLWFPNRSAPVFETAVTSPRLTVSRAGTEGSNPSPSSRQSVSLPHPLSKVENPGFPRGCARLAWRPGRQRRAGRFDIAPTRGNISVGPYSSTAVPTDGVGRACHAGPNEAGPSPGLKC